jgi:hypothetical protein
MHLSALGHGTNALIAQSVEHVLGKNGVMGSNPIEGSRCRDLFKIFIKKEKE